MTTVFGFALRLVGSVEKRGGPDNEVERREVGIVAGELQRDGSGKQGEVLANYGETWSAGHLKRKKAG